MKIGYTRFFDVVISHAYYDTAENQDFDILPTAETVALLARFNLLFKTTASGFTVLYELDPSQAAKVPLKPVGQDLVLRFALQPRHPYVLQISDLPLDQSPFYWFHNLNDNLQAGTAYLSDVASGGTFASAADRLNLRPEQFALDFPVAGPVAKLELFDTFGGLVLSGVHTAVAGRVSTFIDVSSSGSGRFTLKLDGVIKEKLYADSALARARAFGVVEIRFTSQAPTDYRLLKDDGSPQFRRFAVRLANRSVTWRYFVVPRFDTNLTAADLVVEDGSARYGFPANGTATRLGTGEAAVTFASHDPIPLQRLPVKNLHLKKRANGGGLVELVSDLPNPRLDSLGYDPAIRKVFSDIFVYV